MREKCIQEFVVKAKEYIEMPKLTPDVYKRQVSDSAFPWFTPYQIFPGAGFERRHGFGSFCTPARPFPLVLFLNSPECHLAM